MQFKKWILFATALMALLILLPVAVFWNCVSRYDDVQPGTGHYQLGIVLGAALWDGKPSPALKERCQTAIMLYQQGKVDYLLLSGGPEEEGITEAESMKQFLVAHGVPGSRIILEKRSTNTKENMQYSAAILKQKPFASITVITHDYHMYRALQYAKWFGIKADPSPVHSKVLFVPYHKARECLALVKQQLLKK
ncbi:MULTISPECIES: YdcF family protein [unclassified Thermoactinomyces]|jgi:uncharacterized SAM-binding protein YcdF (DUF218 family)|uniref:YdcF family protein n=1 Tax=unclassified Thermoactinomyces TaxID=2634588 RepID=UPI0018DBE25F|nr:MULTISPECIES: YdcF family protein [unclassified Thermoactinomyces]MBH8598559.1 YdcF family protein [Thermoactinomyces sp. CICC 10523]MBH8604597.1 YdcF family protein [Thermoactinomyces sp. CICC 10522]MBH8606944.1 YdcF family protein [Thermoactinomyces sp. CICC 10521]